PPAKAAALVMWRNMVNAPAKECGLAIKAGSEALPPATPPPVPPPVAAPPVPPCAVALVFAVATLLLTAVACPAVVLTAPTDPAPTAALDVLALRLPPA